jgi:putative ABC transport system permease protein
VLAWIRRQASRVRSFLAPGAGDREFEDELASHLELATEENLRRGMAHEEARRAARLRLGGLAELQETNRELRGMPRLEVLLQDARFALRVLRRNPGFTCVALLTLALGVGANTALFSVVHALLLKPLPYADADALYNVFEAQPEQGVAGTGWSYPNLVALREQANAFSAVAGTQQHQLTLTSRGEPAVVNTATVSPDFFVAFGEPPLLGRPLRPEDGAPGAAPVVVLGETLWRGRFASDPGVIGSVIQLDQRAFTVVGVMSAAFRFPRFVEGDQIWIPLAQDPLFGSWTARRSGHWLQVTGRLKPGVSPSEARAQLTAIGSRLAAAFPAENQGWVIRMVPLQQMIVGQAKTPLLVLLGAVGLVLLIACANIANLLLARATARAREMGVRAALGASRARIVRQLLSEAAVLGLLGGAAGIGLAYGCVPVLSALIPASLPRVNAIRVDARVLLFGLALSAVASIAFGLAPALLAARADRLPSVPEHGPRAGEPAGRRRARSALAAFEIALATVVLVAAGLLLRSFARLTSVHPGFEVQHVLKADVSLPRAQYATPREWTRFSDELLSRLQSEPGLRDSALVVPRPIADRCVTLSFEIVGRPAESASASQTADYVSVSPDYFRVMAIPLLAGRVFERRDAASAPRVAIVSRALARGYFPNQDPLGRRLRFGFPPGAPGEEREIVGVVGDVRAMDLGTEPGPMMYVPYAQEPFWGANLVVRSALRPESVAAAIRAQVRRLDKDLPVTDVAGMPEVLQDSVAQPRFKARLLALCGAMALALAATGIFGVVSYSVSRRTSEIGVRLALGASHAAILRLILGETLTLTLAGLARGGPAALAAARLLSHELFELSPGDPLTLAGVAATLAAVALVSAIVPARRATRVEALVALRHE